MSGRWNAVMDVARVLQFFLAFRLTSEDDDDSMTIPEVPA